LFITKIKYQSAISALEKMTHFFVILSAAKESECAKCLEKAVFWLKYRFFRCAQNDKKAKAEIAEYQ
jgi:hypothetical protein